MLTFDQQGSRAVGLPPVVLGKAGVSAFICSGHIEDLQASVLPDQNPEEKQESIPSSAVRYEIFSAVRRSKVQRVLLHMHDEK